MHDTMDVKGWMYSSYWTSFVAIKVYILLNIVVAVIFEKLESRSFQKNFCPDMPIFLQGIENFITTWSKYDPYATQYIPTSCVEEFMLTLPAPLGFNEDPRHELNQNDCDFFEFLDEDEPEEN